MVVVMMTSLPAADCSTFLPLRRKKLDPCPGIAGLCWAHFFSLWPSYRRLQKSHDKVFGDACISAP